MILQSLYSLYLRLSEDPDNGLPAAGFSLQSITFRIVLREDGSVVQFQDARRNITTADRKGRERTSLQSIELLVPGQTKSTGQGINPCTLWDNLTYLAGYPQPDKNAEKAEKNRLRAPRCYEGSKALHIRLFKEDDTHAGRSAVAKYFSRYKPDDLLPFVEQLPEDARKGNGVFQLSGDTRYCHAGYRSPPQAQDDKPTPGSQCLVTGERGDIARLHEPKIKTFDPKGSLLVSFNEPAYESFGKNGKDSGQGRNSPVSEQAVFAYCNALNWLLDRRNGRRIRIGDATAVFWTAQPTPAEALFPFMMSGHSDAEDDATKDRIREILTRISRGTLGRDDLGDLDTEFYLLGLSPNASRLSVRFWHTGTLRELTANLKLHLNQIAIVRQWDETNSKNPEPSAPSIKDLLLQTAPLKDGRRDESKVPPLLAGSMMRSVLDGTPYPESLLHAVMNRIRVIEKKPKGEGSLQNVTYLRAAILKGWLMRNHKAWLKQQDITMTTALDKDNPSVAYQLGRLFAVYEQAQRAAHGGKLERTIRETMFSSASANPLAVFGRLDRLNKYHLQKLKQGSNRYFSNLIDEIHQKVLPPGFYPASLDLKGQSLFCIGYYHQRHDLRVQKSEC